MQKVRNLQDLAALAGVSAPTVSRALSDSPLLSKATRERIKHLAHEHGYRPNVTARNLRNQRTSCVAVTIPPAMDGDPFYNIMLGLLSDGLAARRLEILLTRRNPGQSDWLEALAGSGRVDGVILLGQSDQFAAIESLATTYRALVVWGGHVPGQIHCSVGSDNHLGGDLAVSHLLERGCSRIAFLGDPAGIEIGQRLAGGNAALARAGAGNRLDVVPMKLDAGTAYQDIFRYVSTARVLPDGIFAASDLLAMNTLKVLSDCGLCVPGDIRVIGFDGLPIGKITVPALSTISQDLVAGTAMLIDRLQRRIAGEDVPGLVIPPSLQVRFST